MRIFQCIGYDVQSGSTPVLAGYYIEGDNGLYAFTYGDPRTINVDLSPANYCVEVNEAWPFIREINV